MWQAESDLCFTFHVTLGLKSLGNKQGWLKWEGRIPIHKWSMQRSAATYCSIVVVSGEVIVIWMLVECLISRWARSASWWWLYSAVLCFQADQLCSSDMTQNEWLALHSSFLTIHWSAVLTAPAKNQMVELLITSPVLYQPCALLLGQTGWLIYSRVMRETFIYSPGN